MMLTVCTHNDSTPKPYIIFKTKPGYGVAQYSHRVILNNLKLGWKYRKLAYDGVLAQYTNRKAATEAAEYLLGR